MGEVKEPKFEIKPLSKEIIHAKKSPIIQTNIHTLKEIADFNQSGIASIIFFLNGTIVKIIHSNHDRKTSPNPCCQVNHNVHTTTKAKKPFISSHGANAKGNLAQRPINNVANQDQIIVASVTLSILIPACDRIDGFTIKI